VVDNRCAVEDLASAHRAVFSERSAAWISNTSHRWNRLISAASGQSRQAGERSEPEPASLAWAGATDKHRLPHSLHELCVQDAADAGRVNQIVRLSDCLAPGV